MRRTALIIDDEPIWGQSLSRILDEADFEVIGNERTMASALPAIEDRQPDLVVTEMAGLELLAPLRAARPDMRIVVLSHVREHDAIERALAAGVNVYVFKTSHPGDIVSALRQAFEATFILRNSFAGLPRKAADDGVVQERIREAGLTRRELEMLGYISEGRSNREIARTLWVTEQTVKFHLSNIYRKLAVSNRTEASRWAHMNGLVASAPEVALTGS